MKEKKPTVFISYSHDSPTHKEWVIKLATKLQQNGIDVIFDKWDLKFGADITQFMENGLSKSDRVLLICSENYVRKADEGKGGVGYERKVVTSELINDLNSFKFIPVIRQQNAPPVVPRFLGSRLYIDFSNDNNFENQCDSLLRELHNEPEYRKPPIGKNPFISKHDVDKSPQTNNSSPKAPNSANHAKSINSEILITPNTEIPDVTKLLRMIIISIVDFPEDIQISQINNIVGTIIEVKVHPDDLGKIIGKQGSVVKAIGTILADLGIKYKQRFKLGIV